MLMIFKLCPGPAGSLDWYACVLFISVGLCYEAICDNSVDEFCEKHPDVCEETYEEWLGDEE
jgi:hypothetical protein